MWLRRDATSTPIRYEVIISLPEARYSSPNASPTGNIAPLAWIPPVRSACTCGVVSSKLWACAATAFAKAAKRGAARRCVPNIVEPTFAGAVVGKMSRATVAASVSDPAKHRPRVSSI